MPHAVRNRAAGGWPERLRSTRCAELRARSARSAPARRLGATLAAAALLLAACMPGTAGEGTVRLGVGSTLEQRVLAAVTITALERAGIAVAPRTDLGGTVDLRRMAQRGAIDLYWDYTGAAWALGLENQGPPSDPVESYERVAQADAERGLVWLEPSPANATLALFVRRGDLPPPPGGTMSWLAGELSAGGKPLCADPDFLSRPAGYDALAAEYSIETGRVEQIAVGEAKALANVADGVCFAALATATSGTARQAGLVAVEDDQHLFPAFVPAPVAREEVLEAVPDLAPALETVTAGLTTDALATLNARLADGDQPQDIAEDYLGG